MKLAKENKAKAAEAKNKEELNIEAPVAGMELTGEELENVDGGNNNLPYTLKSYSCRVHGDYNIVIRSVDGKPKPCCGICGQVATKSSVGGGFQ